jgi:pSer/pThr/pTyr-binding forkhead associated (FHA) protein
MKLSLVVLTAGKQEGKLLTINLAQFVIGRDPQCHLRPASPSISKRHCALIQRDGQIFLRDFDSTNGTFVNDEQIKGEIELHEGDRLKVGPLEFKVKIEATPAVNRPTPAPPTKTPAATTPNPAAKKPEPSTKPAPTKVTAEAAPTDDDSIAAMLLSLQDDSEGSTPLGGGEVPEGSTVMDLGIAPPGEGGEKPGEPAKPAAPPSTSNAAKALLDKYMRRPR